MFFYYNNFSINGLSLFIIKFILIIVNDVFILCFYIISGWKVWLLLIYFWNYINEDG